MSGPAPGRGAGCRPGRRTGSRLAGGLGLLLAAMGLAHADQPLAGAQAPLIFAAASLKPALDAITASPAGQAQAQVQLSYAASSQLARQIDHGAPADVFISADQRWLDWLQERGRIDVASRIDLLGNALVLVAPTGRFSTPLSLMPGVDLARLLGADGRIALAETNNVPAGRYAREALTRLGMWQTLEPRIVAAENVRAALNFAVRGEVPLAVVYRSDARSTGAVDVLATFPADSHTPIVYPAARLRNGPAPVAAARWLALLCSEDSQTIFIAHGFDVLSGCNDVSAADQPHR